MKISRSLPAALCGVVVLGFAGQALADPVARDSKRSCKKKKEQKGCKLPKDARYEATDKQGERVSSFTVRRSSTGGKLVKADLMTYWTGGSPRCGQQTEKLYANVGFAEKPKVGGTYTGKSTETIPDFRRDDVTATVKVSSAKKVKLDIKGTLYFTEAPGDTYTCSVNFKGTAKRTQ